MSRRTKALRTPLQWLKSQLGVGQGPPPEGERRTNPRRRMRFEAQVQQAMATTPVVGVDIHEDGARILSRVAWETGTLLFLRLNEVQLGGFAEVRHCTRRKDGRYAVGLAFRGRLIPQGDQWQIQRVCQPSTAWTMRDDVPPVSDEKPQPARKPREVA